MKTLATAVMALAMGAFALQAGEKVGDITTEDLNKALAEKKVVVIDVNGTQSWKAGHIPTALDYAALGKEKLLEKLPEDKSTLIVAYCGGPMCSAYKRATKVAQKAGYTNVAHYSKGLSGWKAEGQEVEQG